jgi:hypothetical protein
MRLEDIGVYLRCRVLKIHPFNGIRSGLIRQHNSLSCNSLRIGGDDFHPGRIPRCPECDSEKIVFPVSRGRKRKSEPGEISWRCSDCGCAGFQSGCIVVVTRDGKQPGSV